MGEKKKKRKKKKKAEKKKKKKEKREETNKKKQKKKEKKTGARISKGNVECFIYTLSNDQKLLNLSGSFYPMCHILFRKLKFCG